MLARSARLLLGSTLLFALLAIAPPPTSAEERGSSPAGRADVRDFGARGDGSTDDTTAFVGALGRLASGGVLSVPPGTYCLRPSTLVIGSNITVRGERATIIPCGPGFGYEFADLRGHNIAVEGVVFDGAGRVVRGLTIVAGGRDIALSRDVFQNFTLPSAATDPLYNAVPVAIRIEGEGEAITIDSVVVRNVVAPHANDTRDGHPTAVARGIWISAFAQRTTSTNVVLRRSVVAGVGPKDDGDCVVIQDPRDATLANLVIAENIFYGCAKRAIKIQVPGATITNNLIVNTFDGDNPLQFDPGPLPQDMYAAISAYAGQVTIRGNTIRGPGSFYAALDVNGSCAATLDRVTIEGNVVAMGAKATAMDTALIRAFGPVTHLTVAGNTLARAQVGIAVPPGMPTPTLVRNRFVDVATPFATRAGC